MTEESSSGDQLIDEIRAFPKPVTLKIEECGFWVGSESTGIKLHSVLESFPFADTILAKGEHELEGRFPVEIYIQRNEAALSEASGMGAVGYMRYHDPIRTDDGVVDSDASVSCEIAAANETFEHLLLMVKQEQGEAFLCVDVKGLEIRETWAPVAPGIWDVEETPVLHIVDFSYNLPPPKREDDQEEEDELDPGGAHAPSAVTCRFCTEEMKAAAHVCPHCGKNQRLPEQIAGWFAFAFWAGISILVAHLLFKFVEKFLPDPTSASTTMLNFLVSMIVFVIAGSILFWAWATTRESQPELLGHTREELIDLDRRTYAGCYVFFVIGGATVLAAFLTITDAKDYLFSLIRGLVP